MNIQYELLGSIINLYVVILISLFGLLNFLSINGNWIEYYDNYYYYDNFNGYDSNDYPYNELYPKLYGIYFYIYQYLEFFFEINEFILVLIMLLISFYYFIKRLLTGGIKTQFEINNSHLIFSFFKNLHYFHLIFTIILFIFGYAILIFIINKSFMVLTKLLFHSNTNLIIMIFYISIIKKHKRLIDYILKIKNSMNSLNVNNQSSEIDFIDVYKKKQILKTIIINNLKTNLFYELKDNKENKNEGIDSNISSETIINNLE